MNINTPYVPTATQLQQAVAFTNFDAPLNVQLDEKASQILGKDYYQITQSFRYYLSEDQKDVWGYVPAGFLTDGASVPRPLWWLIAPFGVHGQAAVLHDILCETGTMFRNEIPYEVSRKEADQIFRDAMKATRVSWWKRNLMYGAVRLWSTFGFQTRSAKTRQERKRQLEIEYMKAHGTYREPTAILRQITHAAYGQRRGDAHVNYQIA